MVSGFTLMSVKASRGWAGMRLVAGSFSAHAQACNNAGH